ncbi:GNAT family N-acetyltransferase [Actinacidiphila sp. bgisy167]|uniref:GNAT family N-acetyltransferase n=1 Tax=Actinacidiphila sp. bgisy167 TaxID=3413797 RepID=UPI003D74A712
MPEPVILDGRHVRLEPLRASHTDGLLRAATESRDTYAYTQVPDDHEAMARYVEQALQEQASGTALPFAVRDVRRDMLVGSTRFLDLGYWTSDSASAGRSAPCGGAAPTVAEIGSTWLAASVQRTPCNTEAKLLLSHAFDVWGVLRVTLKTDARNTRSRTAIERIGARFEGIRRAHTRAVDGTVRDSAYYSVLAEEWPGVRAALKARLR